MRGRIFTANFRRFKEVHALKPDAIWVAVTDTHGWKRGGGEVADLRRLLIQWRKELAPSKELRRQVKDGLGWPSFRLRYVTEMAGEKGLTHILELAHCIVAGRDVVLMCYENAGEKCHRTVLAELLAGTAKSVYDGELVLSSPAPRS